MRYPVYLKLSFIIPFVALLGACIKEDASELGSGMVDPASAYIGIKDTVYLAGTTVYDDSLLTSDYSDGLTGRYDDAVAGTTWAFLYADLAPGDNVNTTDSATVDSLEVTLYLNGVFTTSSASTHHARVRIHPLTDTVGSKMYSNDTVAWDAATCYLDETVEVETDAKVLTLKSSSQWLTQQRASDFLTGLKGLRFSINESTGDDLMLDVNMAATNTKLTVYCSEQDSANVTKHEFLIGNKSGVTKKHHFVQFKHDYSGSELAQFATAEGRASAIDGLAQTYLQPMGGTRVVYKLDSAWLSQFREEHPYAVINYAELLLPVQSGDSTTLPSRLLAYRGNGSEMSLVSDMLDVSRNPLFDGYFNPDTKHYRMLIVRHLQQMLTSGADEGTSILIDARRSSPRSAVLNGSSQSDRPRIVLVYSE